MEASVDVTVRVEHTRGCARCAGVLDDGQLSCCGDRDNDGDDAVGSAIERRVRNVAFAELDE